MGGRADVALLPNGIDAARASACRAAPRGPRATVTIASVLRLHARKRPLALVRALPEVLGRAQRALPRGRVRLVVAGDGPLAGAMRAEAARLGVADQRRAPRRLPRATPSPRCSPPPTSSRCRP